MTLETSFTPPRRLASWWSRLDDLQWPQPQTRDRIRRRADALAEADVDTVIQFGFHCRFDFYPYFGLLHGYLADVAENLHQRGLRFLDHYSCDVIARPNSPEELERYHSRQRHHVPIHPDPVAAETASYAGHRLNDLRCIDVETGRPVYVPTYNCEIFCLNNPGFREMHEAYLRRLFSEVPLDGAQVDDMCNYGFFRACGCEYCRGRFREEYGHELPPVTDRVFWGSKTPDGPSFPLDPNVSALEWGNYANGAFRDWVRFKHRYGADHLTMVKEVIGREKILFTCCSSSGPMHLNAMGLSQENFIEVCDWLMLENCGLTAHAAHWQRTEPEAMLTRAVAARKNPGSAAAPAIACSYSVYEDGAYLGWAIARFWGAPNWFSTLTQGLPVTPDDAKDDAELIGPFNRWEKTCSDLDPGIGRDAVECRLAFVRAARDNGWRDEKGRDHWERVSEWSLALLKKNIGYSFVIADDLAEAGTLAKDRTPLILDSCAHLSRAQREELKKAALAGVPLWVVPPLGTHDEKGETTASLLDEFEREGIAAMCLPESGAKGLGRMIAVGRFTPRIRRISGHDQWRARIRIHNGRPVLHLLNDALTGIEHPEVTDRWQRHKILHKLEARDFSEPLVLELDMTGIANMPEEFFLLSPELDSPRKAKVQRLASDRCRVIIDLQRIRIYAVLDGR